MRRPLVRVRGGKPFLFARRLALEQEADLPGQHIYFPPLPRDDIRQIIRGTDEMGDAFFQRGDVGHGGLGQQFPEGSIMPRAQKGQQDVSRPAAITLLLHGMAALACTG